MSKELLECEEFAVEVFRMLWLDVTEAVPRIKKYDILEFEKDYYGKIVESILIRRIFFAEKFRSVIRNSHDKFSRSNIDFYNFLVDNYQRILPYKKMSVFDRVFHSCGFVFEMGVEYAALGNTSFQYSAPLCWALHFDAELKEFFAFGGWSELELRADDYVYSKPLTVEIVTMCDLGNDLQNARFIFETAMEDYDLSQLISAFKRICAIRKRKQMHCSRCEALFVALNVIAFPGSDAEKTMLVEGYMQIFLTMLSEDALQVFRNNALKLLKLKESDLQPSCAAGGHSTRFSKKELRVKREKNESLKKQLKRSSTNMLISLIFSCSFESVDESECIFCSSNTNEKETEVDRDIDMLHDVSLIEATINKTINKEYRISTLLKTEADAHNVKKQTKVPVDTERNLKDLLSRVNKMIIDEKNCRKGEPLSAEEDKENNSIVLNSLFAGDNQQTRNRIS